MFKCAGCGSSGFRRSRLGPKTCTFCDGTESGNPPSDEEVENLLGLDLLIYGSSFSHFRIEQGKSVLYRIQPDEISCFVEDPTFFEDPTNGNS